MVVKLDLESVFTTGQTQGGAKARQATVATTEEPQRDTPEVKSLNAKPSTVTEKALWLLKRVGAIDSEGKVKALDSIVTELTPDEDASRSDVRALTKLATGKLNDLEAQPEHVKSTIEATYDLWTRSKN